MITNNQKAAGKKSRFYEKPNEGGRVATEFVRHFQIRSRGICPHCNDVAFLTVDGFCAESGNLDVGVSDAKEFKSVVHEHFKAFFRK